LIKSESLKIDSPKRDLGIVDFCTGTGCIPLLLYALLYRKFEHLEVLGVDISAQAINLARSNIDHNIRRGHLPDRQLNHGLGIMQENIFQNEIIEKLKGRKWDVMVSNPPYISRRAWNYGGDQVGYSVRKYEPSLALVPGDDISVPVDWNHEDVFYARLLEIACHLKPRVMLLEIGDKEQARRVMSRFLQHNLSINSEVQVWRDWPDLASAGDKDCILEVPVNDGSSRTIPIQGDGNIRSIFIRLDA
jgi:HemK-like putative methylase